MIRDFVMPVVLLALLVPNANDASARVLASTQARDTLSAGPPRLTSLNVEIWPEYDDPRVLVIYAGRMEPSVSIPADFTLVIPREAQVHMAGYVDADGVHRQLPFETRPRDDGLSEIYYPLPTPDFYVEFYYEAFPAGEERRFSYPLVPPGDVEKLTVSVQQPLRAEGFLVSPFTLRVVDDDKGFLYHVIEMDTVVTAGAPMPIAVSYRKQDQDPSIAAAPAGAGPPASGGKFMTNALALVAVLLVGAAAFALFVTSDRRDTDDYLAEIRHRARGQGHGPGRYCPECGEPTAPTDRYCGSCGHPIQAPDVMPAHT